MLELVVDLDDRELDPILHRQTVELDPISMTNSNILLQPLEKTRNVNDELASFRQTTGDERVPHSWYAPVPSPHKETALGAGGGGGITQNEMRFCVCPNLISEEHDPLLRGSRRHACFPDTDLVKFSSFGCTTATPKGVLSEPLRVGRIE